MILSPWYEIHNMDRNQPIVDWLELLQPEDVTFEPTKESLCSRIGPLEWMTEAKSINVS